MGGRFLLSGAGLPKNMYKSRKSVLLELLNIEICAILYNVYPKRKGNLTLLHYDAILFDVDGTLIDSAPGILNTLEEVFSSMGVDVARSDLGRYIGPPLRKSFGEHFSDPAKIEEATKRYRVSYAAKGCHDNMDKKDKSEHGYYFTMHNKKSEKSCMGCQPGPLHGHLQAHRRCEAHPRRAGPCALLLLRGRCVHG